MSDYSEIIARARGIHGALADDLFDEFRGFLHCRVCDRREGLTRDAMARYFKVGWPKCHDGTMTWWTRNQIANGDAPPSPQETTEDGQ
jgi:hypothetical protein